MNALTTIPSFLPSLPDPPFPLWLTDLHTNIWKRGDLKLRLFRKVKVTQVHYDALQDNLKRKYLDHDLAQYDGRSHQVLCDKLDILKPTTWKGAFSPQHIDNNEHRVDDGDDPEAINSLFPSTFSFLDLSTLELKEKSDCFPYVLLLREEYNYILNLIKNSAQDSTGSVIVSGQPGMGKVLVSLSCRT